ncbi:MAG: LL-diaminopimelate aminotransferase, partial [Chlamydiia bacterium]|nr:LL-diaminopimelate aminotransferase [Chlamydiia bacterium]
DEVFISDGSKPDIGRLQLLFGRDITMAVQDPAYPAYVASALISGKGRIVYMPCLPENDFFPDLSVLPKVDVIYFCSPNNPTGTVPARDQLESLVHYAREHGCLIVFDSAYAAFIQDPTLCASLYEIDGAKEVVLETGSLSKFAGFTGVRLGWTVVPKALRFADGSPVINDWKQVMSTYFNGACNIAQAGALAALTPEGRKGAYELVAYYMENARLLREGLLRFGLECYGGEHTPYIWARTPGRGSWELFDEILNKSFVVTTPGVGFGSAGEGFLRFSGFGDRSDVKEALLRLEAVFTSA